MFHHRLRPPCLRFYPRQAGTQSPPVRPHGGCSIWLPNVQTQPVIDGRKMTWRSQEGNDHRARSVCVSVRLETSRASQSGEKALYLAVDISEPRSLFRMLSPCRKEGNRRNRFNRNNNDRLSRQVLFTHPFHGGEQQRYQNRCDPKSRVDARQPVRRESRQWGLS